MRFILLKTAQKTWLLLLSGLAQLCVAQNEDSVISLKVKSSFDESELLKTWQNRGYLTARIERKSDNYILIYPGTQFKFVTTVTGDSVYFETPQQRAARLDRTLTQLENEGLPFAKISFRPDSFQTNRIYIREELDPGVFCAWDTMIVKGMTISPRFMKQSADIVQSQAFSMVKFRHFQSSLSAIEGIGKTGKEELLFKDGVFETHTGYGRNRADRLNAMLGLATGESQRPVLTGEFDAAFYGLFGNASSAVIRWQSFKVRSQELKLNAELPYVAGSPFISGISIGFEKFDTLYSRFRRGLVLKFPSGEKWRWKLGFDFTGVTRIYADVAPVRDRKVLPGNHNSKMWLYFGEADFGSVSYNTPPKQGIQGFVRFGAGSRSLIPDPEFAQFQWKNRAGVQENIYDSLKRVGSLRTSQYRIQYQCWIYTPIGRFMVLANRFMGEEIAISKMFFSELSRWGGLNSLRGFNEQSIFANSFHLAMTELRFMAGNSGFIAPFLAVARYSNKTGIGGPATGVPFSTGIAASFRTGAGILQLCWAVGSDQGMPFNLNNSKFHLGIGSAF